MSYANMDHAGWVEMNNAAGKRMNAKRKPRRDAHGCTIGYSAAPDTLSPFQARTMDILGIVGGGIYNAPIAWGTVDWHHGNGVSVIWRGSLATFDFNRLTMLVMLCHMARIRCDVSPGGPLMLRLSFQQRAEAGGMADRHPNLPEAVDSIEGMISRSHRIRFEAEQVAGVAA